jgi:selenocysteine lyase/cysteine desulfurase
VSRKFTSNEEKLNWVRENAVGINTTYLSAVGLELDAVYVDHTATNRPFQSVEAMVSYAKLFTANPHTEYS